MSDDKQAAAIGWPLIRTVYACPGCEDWQVDSSNGESIHEASAAVEEAARDHLAECPPLAAIAAAWKRGHVQGWNEGWEGRKSWLVAKSAPSSSKRLESQ